MSDTLAQTAENQTETSETETEDAALTLDKVERKFFGTSELAEATESIKAVQDAIDSKAIRWNFNPDETEVPDGYGLAIVPIAERRDSGNVNIGVIIAAIPSPELIASHDKGSQFISDTVTDYFLAKVANAGRPKATGTAATLPFSVEDFIEKRRGRESLKTFTELAPAYVKGLREKGLKMLTASLLRQILQSKAFAEQFNAKLEEKGFWTGVLNKMVERAKAKSLDPAVLENWLNTREQAEMVSVDDLDVDDLDAMVANESE